jgi:D-glycero-D-manno-heptose 1,7-bisphosphate phosphatase
MKERALFLYRDGVINREAGYVFRKEQVEFVEGIFSLCRTAKRLGYRLVVVTYQKGLARGVFTQADYAGLMCWMREEFRREGIALDGIYHCPSGVKSKTPDGNIGCKGGAGLLLRAARNLRLELSESILVGSREIDVAAANAGGLRQAFLLRGSGKSAGGGTNATVGSLGEVEAWLVEQARSAKRPPTSRILAA